MSITELKQRLIQLIELSKAEPSEGDSRVRNQMESMVRNAKNEIPKLEAQISELIKQNSTTIVFTEAATDLRRDLAEDFATNRGENVFGVDYLYPEKLLIKTAWRGEMPRDNRYQFNADFYKLASNWCAAMAQEIGAMHFPPLLGTKYTNGAAIGYENALKSLMAATREVYDGQLAQLYLFSQFNRCTSPRNKFDSEKAVAIVHGVPANEVASINLTPKKVVVAVEGELPAGKDVIYLNKNTTTEGLLSAISKLSNKKKPVKKEE